MDHEEILGAIDQGASYRSRCKRWIKKYIIIIIINLISGSNRRNDGWCKWWMDQGVLEGATDGACDGLVSNRRSDGWRKRWISEQVKTYDGSVILQAVQLKVLWIQQATDHGVILKAIGQDASYGSVNR